MGDEIEQIIARYNLERPVSPPAQMLATPSPKCARLSRLNAHLPLFCCLVDLSDKEKPERPVWPPRRLQIKFDKAKYEQEENVEREPLRRRKRAQLRANLFIGAEAGVDGDASGDKQSDNKNDDLDEFIVVDDIEC